MYENHKSVVAGMCIRTTDKGNIVMCDRVIHPSGEIDAVPKFVKLYPGGYVCESYAFPESRLKIGGCALCSIQEASATVKKLNVNPIKASKRNL